MSPTKASGIGPQTSYNANTTSPARTTAAACYSPARPGAVAPTSTSTVASATGNGPPPPQPGAVPTPEPPMTTAKPSLPPPPKAGERSRPPEYYAPVHSTPLQLQTHPPQMSQPSMGSGSNGLPPGSTTSTTTDPSFPASAPPTSLPVSTETSARASLEHPPGYLQNPYASDLTPDQRFATTLQEKENLSDGLPSLGYNDNVRRRANSGLDDESVWDAAKKWGTDGMKWGKEKGKQLGDLHEQVWDSIGRK